MVFDLLTKLGQQRGYMPNKFTIGMGKLIRHAREENGLSQAELAKQVYRRQASVSDIENGKMQPDAETLLYLSLVLNKPVSYFFPGPYGERVRLENIDPLEQELLMQAHRLDDEDLKRLIAQARALAEMEHS
jgi:transcriptional regulator with XRE-family HTH domain